MLGLFVALRACALLLTLEFSGALHLALDGYEALRGGEHRQDDCGDPQDHECAPGCPNCHCWHAGLPFTPSEQERRALLASAPSEEPGLPYLVNAPQGADLDGIYRPPRRSTRAQ